MKKIISVILVAAMLLSMGCMTAFADDVITHTVGPNLEESKGKSGLTAIFFYNNDSDENIMIAENKGGDVGMVIDNDAVEGVTYDLNTNTLTLQDVDMPNYGITTNSMGDDFKLKIEGNCSIASIHIQCGFYSSSLNIIGSGTLTVNVGGKYFNNPIGVLSYLESSSAALSIADTVTLNVYASVFEEAYEEGDATPDSACLMSVYGTCYDTADEAFTLGGKAIEGAKSEKLKNTIYDRVNVAMTYDGEVYYDNKVTSKSDPDGVYCAYELEISDEISQTKVYKVRRFILVPGTDKYTEDKSFGDYGKEYSEEEFDKEFTFAKEDQPVKLHVTSEWREKNLKGEHGVKMKKLDDPDGVYVGDPWGIQEPYSYDNPESYSISRVRWDDSQGVYVQDEDFDQFYCDTAELEAEGYQVETEEVTRNKQLLCWSNPAPFDDNNTCRYYDYVKKASDPDALYAVTGTITSHTEGSDETEKGYSIQKLMYDSADDAYYFGAQDELKLTEGEMKEQGYAFVTETVDQQIDIKYIPTYYGPDDYGMYVTRLQKDGDDNYCCTDWYYDEDDGEYRHDVYKMTYNEDEDVYYVDSDEKGETAVESNLSDEELLKKYEYVTEPHNVSLEFNGSIECFEELLYLDESGKKYVVSEEWITEDQQKNHIYEVDESKSFENGGETYYFTKERADLSTDDVTSTEREVELDSWTYWLEGSEYHHIGTGTDPAPAGVKISGKITSYLDDSDVTVKLTGTDNNFTAAAKGKTDYSFENVPAGKYTLSVSKANHVTREYTVTAADVDVTQDAQICPLGDVTGDGKTNVQDCTSILRYVRKLDTLSDDQLKIGDVTGDGKVNVQDVTRILRHVRKIEALY